MIGDGGVITPWHKSIDRELPVAPYPVTPSGIMNTQSSLYRYRLPEIEQPTLIIKDYIPDHQGNFIKPGHYELALTDDKEFMLIIESHNLIAVIPVFKIAENKEEVKRMQEIEAKKKKRKRKTAKEKIEEKIRIKYAKYGNTPPEFDYVYRNATIEYIEEGQYYLIMYENGAIRAWGAFK